jgi:hypothetical protein
VVIFVVFDIYATLTSVSGREKSSGKPIPLNNLFSIRDMPLCAKILCYLTILQCEIQTLGANYAWHTPQGFIAEAHIGETYSMPRDRDPMEHRSTTDADASLGVALGLATRSIDFSKRRSIK